MKISIELSSGPDGWTAVLTENNVTRCRAVFQSERIARAQVAAWVFPYAVWNWPEGGGK